MSESTTCARCGVLIAPGHREVHQQWHLDVEPSLERPNSPYGFWDDKGRWNQTSEDW